MTLSDAKINKTREIYHAFKKEVEGGSVDVRTYINYQETTLKCNAKDKQAYYDVWFSLLEGESSTIKTIDGTYYDLTKAELYEVVRAMINYGKTLWAKKENLLNTISTATTIEEVEAIRW